MTKRPAALLLLGTLACAQAAYAAPGRTSARMPVSVTVVRSCGVSHAAPGQVAVRCTRGTADRVALTSSEPRIVELERQGTTMTADIETGAPSGSSRERFVTIQF